jgi:hypothetical protein
MRQIASVITAMSSSAAEFFGGHVAGEHVVSIRGFVLAIMRVLHGRISHFFCSVLIKLR